MKKKIYLLMTAFMIIIALSIIGEKPVYAANPVPVDAKHFPDANLRKYLLEFYSYLINEKNEIEDPEQVYSLGLSGIDDKYKVKSLKGIEYLTGLESISCSYQNIGSIDLSKNVKLKWLYCTECGLKSLDLSNNKELVDLFCDNNSFKKLDLSNNVNLERLFCLNCGLTSLDLSNNKKLVHLNCILNSIKSLELKDHPSLDWIDCYLNKMTSLDVTGCPKLRRLQCDTNQLTSLDLSHNHELVRLHCNYNNLTELDVSNNLKLSHLNCHSNLLSVLDVQQNTELESLYCGNPYFTTLDLSKNVKLKNLTCCSAFQLVSVKIPSSITHIVAKAFQNCDNLKYIYLDDTITKIEDYSLGFTESAEVSGSALSNSAEVSGSALSNSVSARPLSKLRKLPLVIGGKKNSAAHRYAKKFGFKFVKDRNYGKSIKKKTMTLRVSGDGTATFTKPVNTKTSVVIPKTVKFKGKTYKVTRIAAKAFCRNNTIKNVTIGANVKEIGSQAFFSAGNLRKIFIKSKKLQVKKVGSKAFTYAGKKNYKKLVIRVPKKCKKTYTALLKKKGIHKKARIKTY